MPVLDLRIIICESTLIQFELHSPGAAALNEHLLKTAEFAHRFKYPRFRRGNIQLDDFLTVHLAYIRHIYGNGNLIILLNIRRRQLDLPVRESRIRKPVSKREKHWHIGAIVISVSDENTLGIKCLSLLAEVQICRCVGQFKRECLCQFSGRIDFTIENVRYRTGPFLTRQIGKKHRLDLRDPGHFHRRSAIKDDTHITVPLHDLVDQSVMGFRKMHMGTVEGF